jgi:RNA ligase-like protein
MSETEHQFAKDGDRGTLMRPFTPFPKIGRLEKDMVVTEKIDGTNAAVCVGEYGDVWAQSRTRFITPTEDNYGFAAWVRENEDALSDLGPGVHFGEWWGKGIQRNYGLDERRFSLFNTGRWQSMGSEENHRCVEVPVCHVVPVLLLSTFNTVAVQEMFNYLRETGSVAAQGFMNPEGVVVFHTARGVLFKLSDAKSG